jgi:hypothetical protein
MEVSGQFPSLYALSQGKEPPSRLDGRLSEPKPWLNAVKKKISCPSQKTNPDHAAHRYTEWAIRAQEEMVVA